MDDDVPLWSVPHLVALPVRLKEAPEQLLFTLRGPAWFGTGRRWARSDALRIRLAAPPVDGKANDALIDFPAEAFRMPARNVTLMAGHASRSKCMRVDAPARRPDQGWG